MPTGMRHKAVLVLGFALGTLVVACGGTQPLPDIEATVQARLTEERAIEATVEAKAQAMAKAISYCSGSAYGHASTAHADPNSHTYAYGHTHSNGYAEPDSNAHSYTHTRAWHPLGLGLQLRRPDRRRDHRWQNHPRPDRDGNLVRHRCGCRTHGGHQVARALPAATPTHRRPRPQLHLC